MADSTRDHLERLIFEVHGAEKGADMLKKLSEQEDKYTKSLKGLKKQAEETAKAQVQADKDVAESAKKRAEVTAATMKTAGAGLAALVALAVKASAELERADGRLERSARKVGASQADLARTMGEVDGQARKLGLGLIDQREAMSRLLDATGDLKTAQSDLALINDIVATGDSDLKGAIELVTKARKGEIEELKRLDGVNKTTIEAMGAIADNTQRGAEAIKLLKTEYAGAADGLKGTTAAFENLKQAGTDLLAVLGDVGGGLIGRTIEWTGILDGKKFTLDNFAAGLRDFSRQAKEAASNLEAILRFRGQEGGMLGERSFMSFVDEVETERAMAGDPGSTGAQSPVGNRGKRNYAGYKGAPGSTVPDRKKKGGGGRAKDAGPSGFEGEFGGDFATLEEARGAEEQALQEREDRRQLFVQRMNSLSDEERAQWERDQAAFVAHQKKMGDAAEKAGERRVAAKEAELQAALAGADAAMGIADSLIANEGVRLAMQSVSTAAQAAVLFAKALAPPDPITGAGPQNLPGAIAMAGAAVELGIAAGMAGKGGGGKKGGGKKGGGARSSGGSLSADRERMSLAGEQSRSRESRAPQTHVVNIYSTFGPSPQQSRELVDAVEREMRNRTSVRRL